MSSPKGEIEFKIIEDLEATNTSGEYGDHPDKSIEKQPENFDVEQQQPLPTKKKKKFRFIHFTLGIAVGVVFTLLICVPIIVKISTTTVTAPPTTNSDLDTTTTVTVPPTTNSDACKSTTSVLPAKPTVPADMLTREERYNQHLEDRQSLGCEPRLERFDTRSLLPPTTDILDVYRNYYPRYVYVYQCNPKHNYCLWDSNCLPTEDGERDFKIPFKVLDSKHNKSLYPEVVAEGIKEHTACKCQ